MQFNLLDPDKRVVRPRAHINSNDFHAAIRYVNDLFPGSIIKDHGHKTKRCALIYHGMGQTPQTTLPLINPLHELGLNVVSIHANGGFGAKTKRSGLPCAHRLSHFCRQTTSVAKLFGDRVITIGYSKGAIHALRAAAELPQVTDCFVVAPAYCFARLKSPEETFRKLCAHRNRDISLYEDPSRSDSLTTFPTDLLGALFEYSKDTINLIRALDRGIKVVGIGSDQDAVVNYVQFAEDMKRIPHVDFVDLRIATPHTAPRHADFSFDGRYQQVVHHCLEGCRALATGSQLK